jgi:hypothetical protein
MSEEEKNRIIKFALIYCCIFGIMSLISGILKTTSAIYHQVIIKDQVAGEPIKQYNK